MKKILIVEDVECNRDLIVQLREDTVGVLTAADGAEGLQLAAREHPDLILIGPPTASHRRLAGHPAPQS